MFVLIYTQTDREGRGGRITLQREMWERDLDWNFLDWGLTLCLKRKKSLPFFSPIVCLVFIIVSVLSYATSFCPLFRTFPPSFITSYFVIGLCPFIYFYEYKGVIQLLAERTCSSTKPMLGGTDPADLSHKDLQRTVDALLLVHDHWSKAVTQWKLNNQYIS